MFLSLACFPELYKLQRSSDLAPLFLSHLPGPSTGQLTLPPDKFIKTPALGPVPGCHRSRRFHAAAESWSQPAILALTSIHDGLSQITSPFYDVSESTENREPSATMLRPPWSAIHAAAVCGPLLTTEDRPHPPGPGQGQRMLTHLVSVAGSSLQQMRKLSPGGFVEGAGSISAKGSEKQAEGGSGWVDTSLEEICSGHSALKDARSAEKN